MYMLKCYNRHLASNTKSHRLTLRQTPPFRGYVKVAFTWEHRLLFSVKTTITIHNIRDTIYNSNYILGSYCFHRKRESAFVTGKRSVYTQETSPLNRSRQMLSNGILCRMSAVTLGHHKMIILWPPPCGF